MDPLAGGTEEVEVCKIHFQKACISLKLLIKACLLPQTKKK